MAVEPKALFNADNLTKDQKFIICAAINLQGRTPIAMPDNLNLFTRAVVLQALAKAIVEDAFTQPTMNTARYLMETL